MEKFLLAAMILFTTTLVAGGAIYDNRYELGLVKPKFKVGSCICRDLSNEFEKKQECKVVLLIGKKQYKTISYDSESNSAYSWTDVYEIKETDEYYKQVACPRNKDGTPALH